jgi:hypothetical protein
MSKHSKKRKQKSLLDQFNDLFFWDKKTIGHFFLGAGLILFILNISSIINFMSYTSVGFPMEGFYASTLSSLFLMSYSLYNIYSED